MEGNSKYIYVCMYVKEKKRKNIICIRKKCEQKFNEEAIMNMSLR